MTEKYNLAAHRGESFQRQWQFLDAEGQPLDFTNCTVSSALRYAYTDVSASAAFTVTVSNPPTSGTILQALDAPGTLALVSSSYFYDIRLTFNDGTVSYPIEGKFVVSPSATR